MHTYACTYVHVFTYVCIYVRTYANTCILATNCACDLLKVAINAATAEHDGRFIYILKFLLIFNNNFLYALAAGHHLSVRMATLKIAQPHLRLHICCHTRTPIFAILSLASEVVGVSVWVSKCIWFRMLNGKLTRCKQQAQFKFVASTLCSIDNAPQFDAVCATFLIPSLTQKLYRQITNWRLA